MRKEVEAFALVFPGVSFVVENAQKAKDATRAKSKRRLLTVPKVGNLVS